MPLILPHKVNIWTPAQEVQPDMSVWDVEYSQLASGIACFLEPMSPQERLTIFGDLDTRGRIVWLPVGYALPQSVTGVTGAPLPRGTIFYRPQTSDAWLLIAPLDAWDAGEDTDHAEGKARYLSQLPAGLQ